MEKATRTDKIATLGCARGKLNCIPAPLSLARSLFYPPPLACASWVLAMGCTTRRTRSEAFSTENIKQLTRQREKRCSQIYSLVAHYFTLRKALTPGVGPQGIRWCLLISVLFRNSCILPGFLTSSVLHPKCCGKFHPRKCIFTSSHEI
jgi:hypothetical protein